MPTTGLENKKSSHLDHFIEIGKALKAFGKDGELLLEVYPSYQRLFTNLPALFLEFKANLLPFFIQNIKDRGQDQYLVKFESARGPEHWSNLSSKTLRIHKRDFQPDLVDKESIIEASLVGFTLIDQQDRNIGFIEELRAFPQQTMAVLIQNGEELLIPLVPEWVIDVNILEKIIYLDLPDGIVEI